MPIDPQDQKNPIVRVRLKTVDGFEPGLAMSGRHLRITFVRADGTEIPCRNAIAAQFTCPGRTETLTASVQFRDIEADVEGTLVDFVGADRSQVVCRDVKEGRIREQRLPAIVLSADTEAFIDAAESAAAAIEQLSEPAPKELAPAKFRQEILIESADPGRVARLVAQEIQRAGSSSRYFPVR